MSCIHRTGRVSNQAPAIPTYRRTLQPPQGYMLTANQSVSGGYLLYLIIQKG